MEKQQLTKGEKVEISSSGENSGLHWPQQVMKLLLNRLCGWEGCVSSSNSLFLFGQALPPQDALLMNGV